MNASVTRLVPGLPLLALQGFKDPHTDHQGDDDRAVVRHRLGVDDSIESHNLVQHNDQGDEDQALTADSQDQGRNRLAHTLDCIDAQEQDPDEGAGKLQGDDHLHTIGNDLRIIDKRLNHEPFGDDHDRSQDTAHDDCEDSGEPEYLEQPLLVAGAVIVADEGLDSGTETDL